jgi:hypothetical protein
MSAAAVQYLGYVLDRDFIADADRGLIWLIEVPPSEAEVAAAVLPAAKAKHIAAINAECRSRLLARYGSAEEQVSRAIGVYGAQEQADMQAGIAATIDASNTASNAALAAADIAAVEAVAVTWPVI